MSLSAERRLRIAERFGAAQEYDAHSQLQREAARALAEKVDAAALRAGSHVLEIGCGTGHLSALLAAAAPQARLLITDLAPAMVARCRERLASKPSPSPPPSLQALPPPSPAPRCFAAMDGEQPAVGEARFELIVSSMTFQWFEHLAATLKQLFGLLAPGGRLAFVTPGAQTFREWREAHAALGLPCGALGYPTIEELRAMCLAALGVAPPDALQLSAVDVVTRHPDARSFLHGLKAIGATVPHAGHEPLPYTQLRSVMRTLEAASPDGVSITYQLVFATLHKEPLP